MTSRSSVWGGVSFLAVAHAARLDRRCLEHQLQAVIKDAAGNASTAGPKTSAIDRTASGPPGGLTVVGGDVSRATNSFDVRWTNPDGQVAPIARAHYEA